MKNIRLTLSALVVAGIVFVGCGGSGKGSGSNNAGSNSSSDTGAIKTTAIAFVNAMTRVDMETARKLITDSSKFIMDELTEKMKTMSDEDRKFVEYQKANADKVKLTVKDVQTTGSDAFVVFETSSEPGKLDTLYLQKQNGKWLADMKRL